MFTVLKKIFYVFILWFSSFVYTYNISYADDALDEAFKTSMDYQLVDKNINDTHVESWFQKTMKIMLKLTVMIWVAVFLYGGIRFLLSMWDDSKAKKVRDNLLVSAIGFVVAFWAWAILQVILSIWTTLRI